METVHREETLPAARFSIVWSSRPLDYHPMTDTFRCPLTNGRHAPFHDGDAEAVLKLSKPREFKPASAPQSVHVNLLSTL